MPYSRPNVLIYIPYPRVNCLKTIPFTAAHTYIAHIWQYPPGLQSWFVCLSSEIDIVYYELMLCRLQNFNT